MATPQLRPYDADLDLSQAQARLDRLARYEWWRWSIAFVVMLALTFGLFVLSVPVIGERNWMEQAELNIGIRALLALVLLFDVFVIHQQVLITRLRRRSRNPTRRNRHSGNPEEEQTEASSPQTERRHLERLMPGPAASGSNTAPLVDGNQPWQHGRIRDDRAKPVWVRDLALRR